MEIPIPKPECEDVQLLKESVHYDMTYLGFIFIVYANNISTFQKIATSVRNAICVLDHRLHTHLNVRHQAVADSSEPPNNGKCIHNMKCTHGQKISFRTP